MAKVCGGEWALKPESEEEKIQCAFFTFCSFLFEPRTHSQSQV